MPILVGIDEAGYGPTLGPLVVAASRFRFHGEPPGDLWEALSRSVRRIAKGKDRRIPIADSKVVYSSRKGIRVLEEAVIGATLASGEDLETELGSPDIPLEADLLKIRPAGRRLAEDLEEIGGDYLGARIARVEPEEYNRLLRSEGNKSILLFCVWSRLLREILDEFPDETIRVFADRHGGRKSYLYMLHRYLGEHHPGAWGEDPESSDYHLDGDRVFVSFQTRAEERHLPVALASMVAKYVREVHMASFNRFWTDRIPDLRPTAGYPQDAERFIRSIRPHLDEMGIPAERVIRAR